MKGYADFRRYLSHTVYRYPDVSASIECARAEAVLAHIRHKDVRSVHIEETNRQNRHKIADSYGMLDSI